MSKKGKDTKKKNELKIIFFIILISAVLFIISTYAWFSTQKNVSITNLQGTVEVAEGLEISLDAYTWTNGIVLGSDKEAGQLSIIDDAYSGHHNISPTEMLPVSTLGIVHIVDGTNVKEADAYENLKMIRGKITNSIELSEIVVTEEQVQDPASQKYPGYFAFDIFLKNSSKTDAPDVLQLNYDSSLEILDSSKEVTGLQNTARVAFAKYVGASDVMADKDTILKETAGLGVGAAKAYITDVAIWEPNAGEHVEYIVENNNKITWSSQDATAYATKTLKDGVSKGFDIGTKIPTYALKEDAIGKEIPDIYKWDGSQTLVAKQNVLQTTRTEDADGAVVDYTISEGVQNLLSATDGTTTFTIPANKVCRLRVYVWLEGQDVDCINYASHGGGIKLNIGLVKGSEIGAHEEPDVD